MTMIKSLDTDAEGTKDDDTVEGECTCLCAVDENLMDNGVDTVKKGAGKAKDAAEGVADKITEGGKGVFDKITGFFKE